MPKKIQSLLLKFLEHLEKNKKLSQLTARNYDFYLKRFFVNAKITKPSQITLIKIDEFRNYLNQLRVNNKALDKSTQNYHLIAIRNFLKFLNQKGFKKILSPKEIKLTKVSKSLEVLTKSDLERILEAPLKINSPEIIKVRDKAILELIFSSGLKVSQTVELEIKSIDLIKNKINIKRNNNSTEKIILANQTKYWLKKYLDKRNDKSQPLFISHDRASNKRNKPSGLTARSVQRLIEKYARASGLLIKVTPQTLRHAYALSLLQSGASLESVQKKLGHDSLQTTSLIYKRKHS